MSDYIINRLLVTSVDGQGNAEVQIRYTDLLNGGVDRIAHTFAEWRMVIEAQPEFSGNAYTMGAFNLCATPADAGGGNCQLGTIQISYYDNVSQQMKELHTSYAADQDPSGVLSWVPQGTYSPQVNDDFFDFVQASNDSGMGVGIALQQNQQAPAVFEIEQITGSGPWQSAGGQPITLQVAPEYVDGQGQNVGSIVQIFHIDPNAGTPVYLTKDQLYTWIQDQGPSFDVVQVDFTDGGGQPVTIQLQGAFGDQSNELLMVPFGEGNDSGNLFTTTDFTFVAAQMAQQVPPNPAPVQGAGLQVGDTNSTGTDGSLSTAATIAPLDSNPQDGILGELDELPAGDICDAFQANLAPEQQLLDDMLAVVNTDNGDDAVFVESVTQAMEDYLDSAHPAMVQAMLGMIKMLHDSNEELVEWSILTQVRTIIENRRQELVTCLDNQKTVGLDKVLNRLFAQYGANTQDVPQESDLVATPPTGGVFESDGSDGGTLGKFYVNVAMQDGAGNQLSNLVDVTGLRKALQSLSSRRAAAATAFDDARDAAAVQWSQSFKNEFLFEYDSRRTANAADVAFDGTITLDSTIGQQAVYAIASDDSDDVASADADYDTASSSDDDYPTGAKPVTAFDVNGGELGPVAIGAQFPANAVDSTGASIAGKTFGGGFDELKAQILIRHALKIDQNGDLERR